MVPNEPPTQKHGLLLFCAPLLVALTIIMAPVFGQLLSSLTAVLALMLLYWCGCWALVLLVAPRKELVALYRTVPNRRPIELILTWLPPVATFAIVFLHTLSYISWAVLAVVMLVALVNGITEELFWRGTFVAAFPRSLRLGYLYPLLWFSAWHIALSLLPGIHYQGGALALIGGAAALGLGWGWVVWRTRDLRSVTIAHLATNFFAFTGLALANWPNP